MLLVMNLAIHGAAIVGGYHPVEKDDEMIVQANIYFREKVDTIFPEFRTTNVLLETQSAEMQVVAGYNIKIHHKLGFTEFITEIFAPPAKKMMVQRILPNPDAENVLGGYKFHDPESFETDKVDLVMNTLKKQNGYSGEAKRLILARTQSVRGTNTHLVFEDEKGMLNSVVCHLSPEGEDKIVYFERTH